MKNVHNNIFKVLFEISHANKFWFVENVILKFTSARTPVLVFNNFLKYYKKNNTDREPNVMKIARWVRREVFSRSFFFFF
jgi:hypothetical protein